MLCKDCKLWNRTLDPKTGQTVGMQCLVLGIDIGNVNGSTPKYCANDKERVAYVRQQLGMT